MEPSTWESRSSRIRPLSLATPSISSTHVRTSPYHAYLASLPKYETESLLADGVPNGKPSTVYYLEVSSDGALDNPEAFTCKLNGNSYWQGDDGQFLALRSRLETSVPYAQRIIAVENILPITLEILGASLNLQPRLFQQHVRERWVPNNQLSCHALADADAMIPRVWTRSESFGMTVQVPRMIDGASPRSVSSWQQRKTLKKLNDYVISPLLFNTGPVPCYPRIFEHLTMEIRVEPGETWTAILLFPPTFDERLPFSKSRKTADEPAPPLQVSNWDKLLEESPEHFTQWQIEYQRLSDTLSASHDPFVLTASLYAHAFGYWEIHANMLDRVVQSLGQVLQSIRTNPADDTGDIYPQQELKELILSNLSVLADTLDHIETLIHLEKLPDSCASKLPSSSSSDLIRQHHRFAALQTRLTRHLPLVQHHIDVVLSQQHILLAHTQLLESRKGIEQADTVKRLTALAFIFIPISTATSFFGMNIQELSPSPRLWVFWVTTAALLAFALVGANWNQVCAFSARRTQWMREAVEEMMVGGRRR